MKPKTTPRAGLSSPRPPPTVEQIAALAHAIWMDRGCPVGRDVEHWLEAERQLGGGLRDAAREGERLDPATSPAARVERALDRVVGPPPARSPTSL